MCGIFAYMSGQPVQTREVLEIMRLLETDQETGEKNPVGGHGAGVAYLTERNALQLVKVGRTNGSPAEDLRSQLEQATESSTLILAHVRHASPQFQDTIKHPECTQPYRPTCTRNLAVLTAHNGYAANYQQLKNNLTKTHHLESQKTQLIDSEVISHVYEEALSNLRDPTKAAHTLYEQIEGTETQGNTIVTLTLNKNQASINAIQKGKTRGLVIWTNPQNEVIICSREKPIQKILGSILTRNHYQKTININRKDTTNIEAHFHQPRQRK